MTARLVSSKPAVVGAVVIGAAPFASASLLAWLSHDQSTIACITSTPVKVSSGAVRDAPVCAKGWSAIATPYSGNAGPKEPKSKGKAVEMQGVGMQGTASA